MKKTYLNEDLLKLSEEEKRTGCASYARVLEIYCGDMVLCNNICEIDESVYYNMEMLENENEEYNTEIFQWYLCNLDEWQAENLRERGIILSYSEKLDCNVICVDHWGTSWHYVMTDSELTTDLNEI